MSHPNQTTRVYGVYALLIVIALSIVTGRIATVVSREGDTPFLSANDRSRWCTIAALVENGTYEIDPLLEIRGSKQNRRPWYTIDLVRHQGSDGKQHYYSSKPPLLPTMIAGVYWGVSRTMGMWLSNQPLYVGRVILWLVNVPMLFVFLLCTILSIDRAVESGWAKTFLAACACFGTMLLPFSISLNNHLPAASATAVVLFIYVRSMSLKTGIGWWLLAGLAGGFTAANELPALSMTVFWAGLLLVAGHLKPVRVKALIGYAGGVAVVAAAFFATNWMAHESLRPPYAHRGDGAIIKDFGKKQPSPSNLIVALSEQGLAQPDSKVDVGPSRLTNRKRVVLDGQSQFGLVETADGKSVLRQWDDWYDYPTSYWVDGRRRGVDLGEPSRLKYLAHMTVGHYGLFSLTPIWLLMPLGLFAGLFSVDSKNRLLLITILVATLVCGVFYVMRPEIDRNYGGVSVCFRWMLWFAPLWIFACAAPVNWLSQRRFGRGLSLALLAVSIASMSTALTGPWQSPWLYRFWVFLGWIEP